MNCAGYFDYNASAPLRREAHVAMVEVLAETGNPSSVHRFGQHARHRIEEARERVAALAGAKPAEVIFTSGGTEANNLALRGGIWPQALVSAIEHDSVLAARPAPVQVPVDAAGIVELGALDRLLGDAPGGALVSLMLANNETGVIQPVAEAAALAHRRGAVVHCDAVQAAGKVSVDFQALGIDLMSLSAHKLGGPQGVGALVIREGLALSAQHRGGGQERMLRAGTENLPGIAGFGAAAGAALAALGRYAGVAALRDRLETAIASASPRTRFYGRGVERLPNTACFTMPGVSSETQVIALDLAGFAVSAGSACSSGKVRPSHVLRAMGAGEAEAGSAIRVSLGWLTEAEEIDRFVEAWSKLLVRKGAAAA